MDNTQIKALQDFVTSLKSEETQRDLLISGAETLLKLGTDGYQTDQARIDEEIQKGRDEVVDQINQLTTRAETAESKVAEHETTIATLTAEKADLQSQLDTKVELPAEPVETPVEQIIQ